MRRAWPLVWVLVLVAVAAELPDDLDAFMEKLFDVDQCEEFISSGEYNVVATIQCEPYTCDFPRQICARPSNKFQDKSANICREIPTDCLTSANGGVPVGPPKTTPAPFPAIGGPVSSLGGLGGLGELGGVNRGRPRLVTPPPNPTSICEMDTPVGRFCGFRPLYTYNRETMQCDEFWFPGCRTAETNANLFDHYHDCQKVADVCRPTPPPTPPPPAPAPARPLGGWNSLGGGGLGGTGRELPSRPNPTPPPPPPAGGGFIDALSGLGGAGQGGGMGQGALGALGMFTGSGLGPTGQGPFGNFVPQGPSPQGPSPGVPGPGPGTGAGAGPAGGGNSEQDLGLFGLIQQGIMGAQAIKQGQGSKEVAAQAAGKILQQFTGFDLGNLGGSNLGGFFGSGNGR